MFNTLSDPFLAAAFWIGTGAFALTLALAGYIVYLRIRLRRNARREQATLAAWRPILNTILIDEPVAHIPALKASERLVFLKLWVHLQASVRGDAKEGMNALARRLHCDRLARALLQHGRRAERLLAILVLGHMRDAAAWDALAARAAAPDHAMSIHALWALVQIDAARAIPQMADLLISQQHWSLPQMVTILQESRELCTPVLAQAIAQGDAQRLPRLLRLAEGLRLDLPKTLLAQLFEQASVDILVGALRCTADPAMLEAVRRLAAHDDWRVRVQAAKVLGRIGERGDVNRLAAMLQDQQWWVRYRAAQALASLPFVSRQEMDQLRLGADDRFAADMLGHVFAESRG